MSEDPQTSVMEASAAAAPAGQMMGVSQSVLQERLAEVPVTAADWRSFYDANWRWVFQVVRRLGGRDIDTEDAVQDVFVVLATKLHTFEGRSQLKTWIYRVCLNVTSEHRRRRQRQRRLEQAASAIAFWRDGPSNAQEMVEARSDIAQVHHLLSKMSRKKREVFVLREIEQLSGEEVAKVLGIPTATVRTRLFHARRDFTRLLEKVEASAKTGGDR